MAEDNDTSQLSRRDFMIIGAGSMVGARAAANLPPSSLLLSNQACSSQDRERTPARRLEFTINGEVRTADVDLNDTLLDVLRERLDLTGTKRGCDAGACGACTVLVDGRRTNACLMLGVMAEGCAITTIEGICRNGELHPLQEAFVKHDGLQCGYCTPGQIMSAVGYLAEGHGDAAALSTIREWMSGNLCRCGAYPNIVAAIAEVSRA